MRLMQLQAKGYPCSQMMIIMALQEQERENPALVRAMAGLANGLGNSSGSCGAMSAAACILALYAGKGSDNEETLETFESMLCQLNEWFLERTEDYEGSLCHEITEKSTRSMEMTLRCGQLIADTYDKVMELLVEHEIDPGQARDDN